MSDLNRPDVVIVNTGCANISSVKFAIERLGYPVVVSDDVNVINDADKVLIPGVGTAKAAMKSIQEKGLLECLQNLKQPTLGICLGMQLMVNHSEEGDVHCLDQIPGEVKRMQVGDLRLPHMGWNQITPVEDAADSGNKLFKGIPAGSYFYFVHGFAVAPSKYTYANCDYGMTFSASIRKGNFYGVQFHPERSGPVGAQLLKNFLEM
jgi:glutamine amidotransferase